MNIPAPPVFRPEDFPDEDPNLLALLTRGFQQLNDGVAGVPETGSAVDKVFTTNASGNTDVQVAVQTSARPTHLSVTDVFRDDGQPLTAAFSNTWTLTNGGIVVTFIGLPASTKMHFSVEYS